MKIVRYGAVGHEKPGLLDGAGTVRDLSGLLADWTGSALSPANLSQVGALELAALPAVEGSVRLGMPFVGTGKFIGIGLNYTDHAAESKLPVPAEPVMFTKAISSLTGPFDPIMLPQGSTHTDWEVELGVVIGTRMRSVADSAALAHVAGYCLVNDVSEREYQLHRGGTWDKGKGCDTFGPVGPWLVTRDEIEVPQSIDLWLEVNGVRRQDGNTANMIFSVAQLIGYLSRFVTLEPGDIVATGTPAGVGMGTKPAAVYLKAGDSMRLGSSLLGTQAHRIEPWHQR